MDDRNAVIAANAAFYRAFESLELKRMEGVWLQAPSITCVHPGWGLLVAWGPAMESWHRIFANALAMHFTLTNVRVDVVGDLAWVVLTENIESRQRDGTHTSQVQATNLFQRQGDRWLLVHHHGSPVYAPLADVGSAIMH